MPDTMPVVKNRTGAKTDGILDTLPDTMIIAIASPMARPTPRTMAAATPLPAAGSVTLK